MQNIWANLETGKITERVQGLDPRTEKSAFDFLELSWTQRLYGFAGCFVAGLVLGVVSAVFFLIGDVTTFAILYVIGILVSLTGSGFLIGFLRQGKLMFKPVRLIAIGILLGCIVMTFVSAFALKIDGLVFIFAIGTFLAYLWYSCSFIPYARALVKKLAGGII